MPRLAPLAVVLPLALLASACVKSPAMKSPLRERLAAADTPAVEDATRECLTDEGWTVDPVGSVSGGSNVVSAKDKDKNITQVYVNQPDQTPRVTGGPDDEKFWKCLASKLGGGGADDKGADKADKPDKGDKDKDEKAPAQDPGDKGGGAS